MRFEYALLALSGVATFTNYPIVVFVALFAAFAVKATESLLEHRRQVEAATLAREAQERNTEAAGGPNADVMERLSVLETKVSGLTLRGAYEKSR